MSKKRGGASRTPVPQIDDAPVRCLPEPCEEGW